MDLYLRTVGEVQEGISERFRARQLALNWAREELATRSGVSQGTLRRFEQSGSISLNGLLSLAVVLDYLDGFDGVADGVVFPPETLLQTLMAQSAARRNA